MQGMGEYSKCGHQAVAVTEQTFLLKGSPHKQHGWKERHERLFFVGNSTNPHRPPDR